MSNKDGLVIQPGGEIISPPVSQSDAIIFDNDQRQKVIQMLRQIPAFLDVAKKLSAEKTYQAVFTPEVLERLKDGSVVLDKKDNGLFGALIREVKTGHVADHVSLKEVLPDMLSSLSQLAVQQTMADMVSRLEVIDEKVTEILQGQANDRLAEVKSGIRLYEQAIAASDANTRHGLLRDAIHDLEGGRSKLLESTDFRFIDKIPRNKLGMFFYPNLDIPQHIQSKAEPVWKAGHAIVQASRYLVLAYYALNELDSLRVSLEQVKDEVQVFQEKMGEIVRWLPPTSHWRQSLMMISQGVLPSIHDLDNIQHKPFVIEFQPKEIAPSEGVEP